MIAGLLARIFGTNNARQLRKLQPLVDRINALEPQMEALQIEDFPRKTNEFRKRISQGESLDDILPEAYALVREASKRTIGQRHYDVQLIGGIVLHQGIIAEMKTGEGKTLTATLPLYLNALSGKGSHLVTVNDYLARRDAEWMEPIYNAVGLEVGCLQNDMDDSERKKVYQSDIMYATNNELGFDYLRDNMKFRLEDYVQRALNFVIVDEVDSILIDEARTPLIISGSTNQSGKFYVIADRAVRKLRKEEDYEVDEKERSVQMTESGVDKIESFFNLKNLYDIQNLPVLHHVKQALRSHALYRLDVEYVVTDGKVLIVDEFTGRILPGRRYSDGLHQALEAKEGVEVERETHTLASITLQNFFRIYKKLSGMTGTAQTEAEEFYKIYKLNVIAIPTNKPLIRKDQPDLIFLTKQAKYKFIVDDLKERYEKKQPVLIGTVAIETSELLSDILRRSGIPHEVLNAKQHEREADIVEHAGEAGHITIATNMAGRGTDIKLTKESIEAGGLYILGTERHESRRIDNQLRGRAGRQGDPGESRFYISLEDDLIRRFAGDTFKQRMELVGMTEDEVIESRFVSKRIEAAQEKVEKYNFEIRRHLLEYDDVLNQQRKVVYEYRRSALEGDEHIYGLIRDLIDRSIQDAVSFHAQSRSLQLEQAKAIFKDVSVVTGLSNESLQAAGIGTDNTDVFTHDLTNFVLEQYSLCRSGHKEEAIRDAEKWLMLETTDQAWKQHMVNLDHLKEGISLRSWGQKNPLIEYKREAFAMFADMMRAIRRDIVHQIFHIRTEKFDTHEIEERRERELEELKMISGGASDPSAPKQVVKRAEQKVGRNDPCPCGSNKKFKKCHGIGA